MQPTLSLPSPGMNFLPLPTTPLRQPATVLSVCFSARPWGRLGIFLFVATANGIWRGDGERRSSMLPTEARRGAAASGRGGASSGGRGVGRGPGGTASAASSASSGMLHNPGYQRNPELFHAVALQQQRLADFKISLAPPPVSLRRDRVSTRPHVRAAAAAAAPEARTANGGGDDDDDDDDATGRSRPIKLTLAQRMGLAEAPEPQLTQSEWDHIAGAARDRSMEPCVICCEPFRDEQQVLLSCGHVFHRQCLRAWERHSKSRVCPCCRKQHYRKRSIDDGANLYREELATRLQACWRGCAARKVTAKALRHANPQRLRRYCEDRLGGLTDQLIGHLDAERSEVDKLFDEIDGTIQASRVLMGGAVDWLAAERVARERGLGDCPVCLGPLHNSSEPLALLSCTHVFHRRCLMSFEAFSITPACLCPVCRAAYTKTEMSIDGGGGCCGGEDAIPEIIEPDVGAAASDAVAQGVCTECSACSRSGSRNGSRNASRTGARALSGGAVAGVPRCVSITGGARATASSGALRNIPGVAATGGRAAACWPGTGAGTGCGCGPAASGASQAPEREARYEAIERLVAIGDRAAAAARARGGGGGMRAVRGPRVLGRQ